MNTMLVLTKDFQNIKPVCEILDDSKEFIGYYPEYTFKHTRLGLMQMNSINFSSENIFYNWRNVKNFIYCDFHYDFYDFVADQDLIIHNYYETAEELYEDLPKKYNGEYIFIIDAFKFNTSDKHYGITTLLASSITAYPSISRQLRFLTLQSLENETA